MTDPNASLLMQSFIPFTSAEKSAGRHRKSQNQKVFCRSQVCSLLLFAAFIAVVQSVFARGPEKSTIVLKGAWRFQLDREDCGIKDRWFEHSLIERIQLPGSLPGQGIGDDVSVATKWMGDIVDKSWFTAPEYAKYRQPGNIKVPFWLQPDKYYSGVAWYQREITLPAGWAGQRLVLSLERPHWETRVWVDDLEIGANDSLSTPHEYELGLVAPLDGMDEDQRSKNTNRSVLAGKHRLTIRVDNRLIVDIGVNSHSISDQTQGNWNGIVGDISLRTTPVVWIEDLQVYPHFATNSVTVKGKIGNATGRSGSGIVNVKLEKATPGPKREPLMLSVSPPQFAPKEFPVTWNARGGGFEFELPVSNPQEWNEFRPVIYQVEASLKESGDSKAVSFGFRDLSAAGTQFTVNGRKIFVRGTLECCIFPKTGHPPTDVESWRRIIRIAKAHGLNLIRFHSWCPPEAAFRAADELGFYYQVEIASWANQSTTLGDGKPVDEWLYREAGRILRAYGNHPSFLLMPYGNEPGGDRANAFLSKWVEHWRSADSRRLYTSGSGWPELPENQFHVTPNPRIQSWGGGLKSRINALPPETRTDYREYTSKRQVPVISHEIGEWCAYPNFAEISKYTGYLKPKNFDIFRDSLNAHHMAHLAHKFLLASGKLQTICYKEEIESALRTPGMGGFELLDLHDFPGQGTALVGVLDPFWEEKGYVTAREFSRFCNSTVPLARLTKRVFTSEETLEAELEVAHFGREPLTPAAVDWRLVNESGRVVTNGGWALKAVPIGNGTSLGNLRVELRNLTVPARYRLVLGVGSMSPNSLPKEKPPSFENDWDIWVYPARVNVQPAPDIMLVNDLTDAARAWLACGGKVLLTLPADRIKGDRLGPISLGFSSIFWNTAWTMRQPPHTLGILCDPTHPALAQFPTDDHSNWQWWYLVSRAGAMTLDEFPQELQPTVQVIDDWVTNRKLALVFEAKVGQSSSLHSVRAGKLIVCSFDLTTGLDQNPVARQMRTSLLAYMESRKFKPSVALTPAQIETLITPPPIRAKSKEEL